MPWITNTRLDIQQLLVNEADAESEVLYVWCSDVSGFMNGCIQLALCGFLQCQ